MGRQLDFRIAQNQYFFIEQCRSCALPGYLILSPAAPVSSLTHLGADAQRQLGPSLSAAVALIQSALSPVKVYCAQFGEAADVLHFHLFPRTRDLTRTFCEMFPDQAALIHGPVLLDWARDHYAADEESVWRQTHRTLEQMKDMLPEVAGESCFAAVPVSSNI